ncbi:MAG: hypothetical protein ACRD2L_05345 [Terriglobia bacterium]
MATVTALGSFSVRGGEYRLWLVSPASLANMLGEVWRSFEMFADDKVSAKDLAWMIEKGQFQFWRLDRGGKFFACALTEVRDYPSSRVFSVFGIVGADPVLMLEAQECLTLWARQQGCTHDVYVCRPGWEKWFKPIGFKKTHVVLERRL